MQSSMLKCLLVLGQIFVVSSQDSGPPGYFPMPGQVPPMPGTGGPFPQAGPFGDMPPNEPSGSGVIVKSFATSFATIVQNPTGGPDTLPTQAVSSFQTSSNDQPGGQPGNQPGNQTGGQSKMAPVQLEILNFQRMNTLRLVNISVGTPPESVSVILDTGSSDLWITSVQTDICRQNRSTCDVTGHYDASKSHSAKQLGSGTVSLSYERGSNVTADLWTETVGVGSVLVQNQTLGVARTASNPFGVLGLSPAAGEANAPIHPELIYPPLLQSLKDQGTIASMAFSIFLNAKDTDAGSIIFGGVDVSRIQGHLTSLRMQKEFNRLLHYVVPMPSFSFESADGGPLNFGGQSNNGSSSIPQVAVLDTGSASTQFPQVVIEKLYQRLGVKFITDPVPTALINCSSVDPDAKLTFHFGHSAELTISIPLQDFVLRTEVPSVGPACVLAISASQPPPTGKSSNSTTSPGGQQPGGAGAGGNAPQAPIILGANVLSAMYIVCDLENSQVAIVPAAFNGTEGSDIRPILPNQPLPGLK